MYLGSKSHLSSHGSWMSYSVPVVIGANKLLSIVISNTLKSVRIVAELRHGVVRSFKVCSAKRAWLPQAIVSKIPDLPSEFRRYLLSSSGITISGLVAISLFPVVVRYDSHLTLSASSPWSKTRFLRVICCQ